MTNLEKLLHDSDKADMELSKRIANIEKAIEELKAMIPSATALSEDSED